jgi:steroid delta-isomerase-like uncharacterized protein
MSTDHRAVIRAWADAVNRRDVDAALGLYTDDYTDHTAGHDGSGVAELEGALTGMLAAFPDLVYTSEDIIVEGDKVVERFSSVGTHRGELMGAAPSGRRITITGINIFRMADGKIAERWAQIDDIGMLQQLGLSPAGHHSHG